MLQIITNVFNTICIKHIPMPFHIVNMFPLFVYICISWINMFLKHYKLNPVYIY